MQTWNASVGPLQLASGVSVYAYNLHWVSDCVASREYRLPVRHLLNDRHNSLTLTIYPAVQAAQAQHDIYPYEVPTMSVRPFFMH